MLLFTIMTHNTFRAIKRELRSIIYLMKQKNFKDFAKHQKLGEVPINVTLIRAWMIPMMENYCIVFNISCHQR